MKNTIPTASERNLCFRSVKPGHQQHRSENMPKTNLNRSLDSVKKIIKLILIFLLKREEHMSLDSCFKANSTDKSRQSKPFQEQSKKKPNNNCNTPRKKTATQQDPVQDPKRWRRSTITVCPPSPVTSSSTPTKPRLLQDSLPTLTWLDSTRPTTPTPKNPNLLATKPKLRREEWDEKQRENGVFGLGMEVKSCGDFGHGSLGDFSEREELWERKARSNLEK